MMIADKEEGWGWDESEKWNAFQEHLFVHMETQELFGLFFFPTNSKTS